MNQELTKELAWTKKFIPEVKSKDFTREWTQSIRSIRTNDYLIDKISNFDFTYTKVEMKFVTNTTTRERKRSLWTSITRETKNPTFFR